MGYFASAAAAIALMVWFCVMVSIPIVWVMIRLITWRLPRPVRQTKPVRAIALVLRPALD